MEATVEEMPLSCVILQGERVKAGKKKPRTINVSAEVEQMIQIR
jgi:hypothetical protein